MAIFLLYNNYRWTQMQNISQNFINQNQYSFCITDLYREDPVIVSYI